MTSYERVSKFMKIQPEDQIHEFEEEYELYSTGESEQMKTLMDKEVQIKEKVEKSIRLK